MARKLVAAEKKWSSVLRVLQEGAELDQERRRCGVTRQAFDRWIRIYLKAHPDADKRPKPDAAPPPPPPDPSPSPAAPAVAPPPPADSKSLIDTAALKAAMEADGELKVAPPQPAAAAASSPPPPGTLSLSTEKDDMEVVEGIGNQVLGIACRGMVVFLEMRSAVKLPEAAMKRLQELYVLTSTEKAMLRPASAHLAHKIREVIGSSRNVAYTVGGSTLGLGLFDRYRAVVEAVAAEFMVQRPDLKAAAAEEERKKAAAGAPAQ